MLSQVPIGLVTNTLENNITPSNVLNNRTCIWKITVILKQEVINTIVALKSKNYFFIPNDIPAFK